MKFYPFYLIAIHFIASSCASVSSPSGGKKDVKPPVLSISSPKNKSRNFSGQNISLEFNEYIKVENLKQELLITPNVEGDYQYKFTKTGVNLNFDKPFRSNTTYTLNFRNAFKDITEKNIAKNIKIVFSTGAVLDTLMIRGNVKDPLKNAGVFDVLVALYRTSDTATIYKGKPYYSTRTDSAGAFALENIQGGEYRIYALEDKNGNLKYDVSAEKIGFTKQPIQLKDNASDLNLKLVTIDKTPPKIADVEALNNQYQISFNEGLSSLKVELPEGHKNLSFALDKSRNLLFYRTANALDSIPIYLLATDSSGNSLEKTIKIKFDDSKKSKNDNKNKAVMQVSTQPKEGEEVEANFTYTIDFNKPIQHTNLSGVKVLIDTIREVPLKVSDFQWNAYKTSLTFRTTLEAKNEVQVVIPEGTFISVENDTSQVIKTNHKLKETGHYGSISGKVTTTTQHFIVQLLSADYKVLQEQQGAPNYRFVFLNAGNYRIRVINDSNNNGKWDSGDLEKNVLPEETALWIGDKNTSEIKLKQNWDLVDINVTL